MLIKSAQHSFRLQTRWTQLYKNIDDIYMTFFWWHAIFKETIINFWKGVKKVSKLCFMYLAILWSSLAPFRKNSQCHKIYFWHTSSMEKGLDLSVFIFTLVNQTVNVAVSCGYDTCFAVGACDGLCHLTKFMDQVETPFGFQSIVWTFVRLYSEIDQIHLSTEAQCGTACLPLGDCHS